MTHDSCIRSHLQLHPTCSPQLVPSAAPAARSNFGQQLVPSAAPAALAFGTPPVAAMSNREDDQYDQRGQRQRNNHETMHRIIHFEQYSASIFQGGWAAAHDQERLEYHNIGFVINCTANVPYPEWMHQRGTPAYDRFPIYGGPLTSALIARNALGVLEPLFHRIEETLRNQQSVIIHCRAGAHRAGAMGVILAMYFHHLNPSDAQRHVRRRRSATHIVGQNLSIVYQVAAEMERARQHPLPVAPATGSMAAPATQSKARPAERLTAAPAAPEIAPTPTVRLTAAPAAAGSPQTKAASPEPPSAAPKASTPRVADASWMVSLSESEDEHDDAWLPTTTTGIYINVVEKSRQAGRTGW